MQFLSVIVAFALGMGASQPAAAVENTAVEIDACALLTAPEISKAIELAVQEGMRSDSGYVDGGAYSSTCVWPVEAASAAEVDPMARHGGRRFVMLHVMRWPAGSGRAHTFLDAFHEAAALGEIPSKPAPRPFGDDALWWGDGLAVREGDVGFGISVFVPGLDADHPGDFEEQLAPHVLARLDAQAQDRS